MTARGRWVLGCTALVAALGSASLALAGKRGDCRRACGARIAACQALTADFGTLGKGCAKAVVKQCVKAGIGSCEVTTTTTFTTTTTTTSSTTTTFPFLATGQRECWNSSGTEVPCAGTGQDGEVRAGARLAYRDNGDGTITDLNTGLMWEQLSDDASLHDKDNTYTWGDAFRVKVATLNSPPCFAGHCDWRLPNVRELASLQDYGASVPAVSQAFDVACAPGCSALTCGCTQSEGYWSSSSDQHAPDQAWVVSFAYGVVLNFPKRLDKYVRAVRGGS